MQRKETMERKAHRPSRVDLRIGVSVLLAYGKCERIDIQKFDKGKMKEKTQKKMTDLVMQLVNLILIRVESFGLVILVFRNKARSGF